MCWSHADRNKYLNKNHEFIDLVINKYILKLRRLSRDQGIYGFHPQEHYDDIKSNIILISN